MTKYFHHLTEQEYNLKIAGKLNNEECAKKYPQPKWCAYPNATEYPLGCWSLTGFMVTGRKYCQDCECYLPQIKEKYD